MKARLLISVGFILCAIGLPYILGVLASQFFNFEDLHYHKIALWRIGVIITISFSMIMAFLHLIYQYIRYGKIK